MKNKKNIKFEFKRFQQIKSRKSLTVLFAGVSTLLSLIVAVFVIAFVFIILSTDVMTKDGVLDTNLFIISLSAVCLIVSPAISFSLSKLFMNPVNKIINVMNKMASGDFKTRINFEGRMAKNSVIIELSDSINTLAEDLDKTEMLKSDFVNNFSHEFKTPIVSISGFAKLLKSENLTEEQKQEYLDIIYEESLRLSDMATNVLNLTKIENQTILTNLSTYNLSEQIRSCFLILENKWTKKELELNLDFDEIPITANEELMQEVWINLIDNAIKFSPEKGQITIYIIDNEKEIHVIIQNTGSSIKKENLSRVFQKFFQEDSSHTTKGNGVGLAIVKKIVDLHKGSIDVKSSDNVTSFVVHLPKDL